jgi:hypothetical protein
MESTRANTANCAFRQARDPIPSSSSSTAVASKPPKRQLTTWEQWPTPSKQTGLRRGTSNTGGSENLGSGWPGTYLDVARAVDHVRAFAGEYHLDLGRVVVVGHSAGGHLAMWTAARRRLPKASELFTPDPLPVRGVMDLAGPVDMTANIAGYQTLCRDTVITSLLGGTPAAVPDHYAQASAIKLLPLSIPQVLVLGSHEEFVPVPLVDAYVQAATLAGDHVRRILIPGAGHFEIASPLSFTWPKVRAAIQSLLDGSCRHSGRPAQPTSVTASPASTTALIRPSSGPECFSALRRRISLRTMLQPKERGCDVATWFSRSREWNGCPAVTGNSAGNRAGKVASGNSKDDRGGKRSAAAARRGGPMTRTLNIAGTSYTMNGSF